MIRNALFIITSFFTCSAFAQVVSEAEVIAGAMKNHPSIVIAASEVSQFRAMERTSFNPDQPRFEIETPSDSGIGFEAEQELSFPTVYFRRKDLFKSQTRLAEESMNLSQLELIKDIRLSYLEAQVAQTAYLNHLKIDSIWQDIAVQSQRLHEAGEINRGDLVLAQNRSGLMKVALAEKKAILSGKLFVLQNYTGESIESVETLQPLPYTTTDSPNYFFESYLAQQRAVTENEIALTKSLRLPNLMIGYLRSTELETQYRYRYKAGITIPIWQGQYTGQINAYKAELERSTAELTLKQQEANVARNAWENILSQTQSSLEWFTGTGIPQTTELTGIYTRLYQAGEITYTQMLRNISDAYTVLDEYLNFLEKHNRAVIELDYLNGKQ